MAAALNVRELLELERQLYQESIERASKQHEELLRGSLEDFVLRCIPFEDEKGWETEAAMVQLQLNKRNGLDLLEFELKQAEDTHQAQRQELKQQLLQTARKQLAKLERRAVVLDQGGRESQSATPPLHSHTSQSRSGRCKRKLSERTDTDVTDATPLPALPTREALEREVAASMRCTARAFNFQHLSGVLPTPASVSDDVFNELERLQATREAARSAVCVRANTSEQTLVIEAPVTDTKLVDPDTAVETETTTFHVDDYVVLTSALSGEDLHGQLCAIHDDAVEFVLICGTRTRTTVAALESGRCALAHQDTPVQALLQCFDERTIVDTKRIRMDGQRKRRGRRKRTVDIRRGF